VLSSAGISAAAGDRCNEIFGGQTINVATAGGEDQSLSWSDLVGIEILGPGKVTSGGGFFGGGLGLEGAAEGMVIAGVLNALTTRSSIQTVLGLLFRQQELWLMHQILEPLALRIEMAPVFARMRAEQEP
jgi:hypothetical protein